MKLEEVLLPVRRQSRSRYIKITLDVFWAQQSVIQDSNHLVYIFGCRMYTPGMYSVAISSSRKIIQKWLRYFSTIPRISYLHTNFLLYLDKIGKNPSMLLRPDPMFRQFFTFCHHTSRFSCREPGENVWSIVHHIRHLHDMTCENERTQNDDSNSHFPPVITSQAEIPTSGETYSLQIPLSSSNNSAFETMTRWT